MKFSTRARYATRIMLELCLQEQAGTPLAMAQVAKNTSISKPYLDQLAMGLRRSALLRARSGRQGGFMLARPAAGISVRDIVEAAIGPLNITECVRNPGVCPRADFCACRPLWVEVNNAIVAVLEKYSLEDLANRERRRQSGKAGTPRLPQPETKSRAVRRTRRARAET